MTARLREQPSKRPPEVSRVTQAMGRRAPAPSNRWQTTVVGSTLLLGICAVPTSAFAQSSLTLYGVVDEGMVYASNQKGHSNLYMLQGMLNSSRWGLIGSEPLSSSAKAILSWKRGSIRATARRLLRASNSIGKRGSD